MRLLACFLLLGAVIAAEVCSRDMKVLFAVDGGLKPFEFKVAKALSVSVVRNLAAHNATAEVAFVQFGASISQSIPMSKLADVASRISDVDQEAMLSSELSLGLARLQEIIGYSEGVRRLVIFTEKADSEAVHAASGLKNLGVELYIVSFGARDAFAGLVAADHLFTEGNFENLQAVALPPSARTAECSLVKGRITTFDGVSYPLFTRHGDFYLVKAEGLEVQLRHRQFGIRLTVGEHIEVVALLHQLVLVDGKPFTGAETPLGTRIAVRAVGPVRQYTVTLAQGHQLVIEYEEHHVSFRMVPAPRLADHTDGLCGHYDGCAADDLVGLDGRVAALGSHSDMVVFVRSWQVGSDATVRAAASNNPYPDPAAPEFLPSGFSGTQNLADACAAFFVSGVVPAGFHSIDCIPYGTYAGKTGWNRIDAYHAVPSNLAGYIPTSTFRNGGVHTAFTPVGGLTGNYTLALYPRPVNPLAGCQAPREPLALVSVPIACPAVGAPFISGAVNPTRVYPSYRSAGVSSYAYPQAHLEVSYSLAPYWRAAVPQISWKVLTVVTPNGEWLDPAVGVIVNANSTDLAYIQPTRCGFYTLEVAMFDGCQVTKAQATIEAMCVPPPKLQHVPSRPIAVNDYTTTTAGVYRAEVLLRPSVPLSPWGVSLAYNLTAWPDQARTYATKTAANTWTIYRKSPMQLLSGPVQSSYSWSTVTSNPESWTNFAFGMRSPLAPRWPWTQSPGLYPAVSRLMGTQHPSAGAKFLRQRVWNEQRTTITMLSGNMTWIPEMVRPVCTVSHTPVVGYTADLTNLAASTLDPRVQFRAEESVSADPLVSNWDQNTLTVTNCTGVYEFVTSVEDRFTRCKVQEPRTYEVSCGMPPIARLSTDKCLNGDLSPVSLAYNYQSQAFPTWMLESVSVDPMNRPLKSRFRLLAAPQHSLLWTIFRGYDALWNTAGTSSLGFIADVAGDYNVELYVSNTCHFDSKAQRFAAICPATFTTSVAVTGPTNPAGSAAPLPLLTPTLNHGQYAQVMASAPQFRESWNVSYTFPVEYAPFVPAITFDTTGTFRQRALNAKHPGTYRVMYGAFDGCAMANTTVDATITCRSTITQTLTPPGSLTVGTAATWSVVAATTPVAPATAGSISGLYWHLVSKPVGSALASTMCSGATTCTFTPDKAGTYLFRQIATDGCTWSHRDSTLVAACPTAVPTAAITPVSAIVGTSTPVSLAVVSTNADASLFAWDVLSAPLGSTAAVTGAATPYSFNPLKSGTYTLRLNASDSSRCNPVQVAHTLTVTCRTAAPTPSVTASQSTLNYFSRTTVLTGAGVTIGGDITTEWRALETPSASYSLSSLAGTTTTTLTIGYTAGPGIYQFAYVAKSVVAGVTCEERLAVIAITVTCPDLTYTAGPNQASLAYCPHNKGMYETAPTYSRAPSGLGVADPWHTQGMLQMRWLFTEAPAGSWYRPQEETYLYSNTTAPTIVTETDARFLNQTVRNTTYTYNTLHITKYHVGYQHPYLCFFPDVPGRYVVSQQVVFSSNLTHCVFPTNTLELTFVCPAATFTTPIAVSAVSVTMNAFYSPVVVDLNVGTEEHLMYLWRVVPANASSLCLPELNHREQRAASFIAYTPGDYLVSVDVSDGCNVWTPAPVTVTVLPPPRPILRSVPMQVTAGVMKPDVIAVHVPNPLPDQVAPELMGMPSQEYGQWRVIAWTPEVTGNSYIPPAASQAPLIIGVTVGVVGGLVVVAVVVIIILILVCGKKAASTAPSSTVTPMTDVEKAAAPAPSPQVSATPEHGAQAAFDPAPGATPAGF